METKKGFLELLLLTDEQEYTIDRYWERGGIFVLLLFILSVLPYSSKAQMSSDSLVQKIAGYVDAIQNFGDVLPQEKVYLHFDNTSYYQGDPIWFQCYVVTPGLNRPTELSKTLYVELLNPGGEIISKRVLPIRNGRCHSSFELTQLPFYSGFYEVRAYTKYMLNFGEEIIFSRVLPVFDKPANPGEYKEKNIQKYAVYKYPQTRKKAMKAKKVNLKFFPEGGNLVKGVPSQVAFEATDAYGNPITLFGRIINRRKEEIGHFATIHEGRGVFTYTFATLHKNYPSPPYISQNFSYLTSHYTMGCNTSSLPAIRAGYTIPIPALHYHFHPLKSNKDSISYIPKSSHKANHPPG